MPHRQSYPLQQWFGQRREAIDLLARAHQQLGEVGGPGRPPELGRPLAQAYILRVIAEFQGLARDLHGLAANRIVAMSGVPTPRQPQMVTAITLGRRLDAGNADLNALRHDFMRLGITELGQKLSDRDQRYWASDQQRLTSLLKLRNALAHGNEAQLDGLRADGMRDTRSWAEQCLPALNRLAGALDRVVWDHLHHQYAEEPW
jgi:hypothetical protein